MHLSRKKDERVVSAMSLGEERIAARCANGARSPLRGALPGSPRPDAGRAFALGQTACQVVPRRQGVKPHKKQKDQPAGKIPLDPPKR